MLHGTVIVEYLSFHLIANTSRKIDANYVARHTLPLKKYMHQRIFIV